MDRARKLRQQPQTAEIVDFDEALLGSFALERRAELMAEAAMLARVFAPEGHPEALRAMARALSSGAKDREMDRRHARGLAAALNRLARQQEQGLQP